MLGHYPQAWSNSGVRSRFAGLAEFFQGEVNETNERAKGTFDVGPGEGRLVTRGASICLYVTRPASQTHAPRASEARKESLGHKENLGH